MSDQWDGPKVNRTTETANEHYTPPARPVSSVQPPTREQITAVREAVRTAEAYTMSDETAEFVVQELLALFPQPTPSAEDSTSDRWVQLARDITAGDTDALRERLYELPGYADKPPSVIHMAPGTEFTATPDGWVPSRFKTAPSGRILVQAWRLTVMAPKDFDPSVIRDVTPPAATAEEGDRDEH